MKRIKDMKKVLKNEGGFTLVELLIVVIILGILAAVVIPQFSASTQDANEAALDSNLAAMRNAIELYAAQHNGDYPGTILQQDDATAITGTNAPYTAAAALVEQLTLYTDFNNNISATKGGAYIYGPYIKKGVPANPVPSSPSGQENVVDVETTIVAISIPPAADNSTGWRFIFNTGQFFANNTGNDAQGNPYAGR